MCRYAYIHAQKYTYVHAYIFQFGLEKGKKLRKL